MSNNIRTQLQTVFEKATLHSKRKKKIITFLTGAGISAESGIPTYRTADGFWVKGSKNYQPEEIGTFKFFWNIRKRHGILPCSRKEFLRKHFLTPGTTPLPM